MILTNEPPRPLVVVPMPQERQPVVVVRLVAAALVPGQHRGVAAVATDERAERIPVVAVGVDVAARQQATAVAAGIG